MEAVHGGSAKLSLLTGSKIHPTVNLSYLHPFDNDPLAGQTTDAESPDPVIAGEDPSEDEFEVTRILDARINWQYRGGRLQFRVAWRGWPDDPTWYNTDDGEFGHAKDALSKFYALPSTKVPLPRSADVTPPSPPTGKPRDESFFPGGVVLRAAGPLHVPYKHLPHFPKPVTLHSPSCTCTLVQITSLNLDYLTILLFSCTFLFFCTRNMSP